MSKVKGKPIVLNFYVSNSYDKMLLFDISEDQKVSHLKTLASEKIGIPYDQLGLIWCGNLLDEDSTLQACGIFPGAFVNVVKKKPKELPRQVHSMTESEIHALVVAFRTLTLNPSYKVALQKLSRPEILDNIIMITPGLRNDPVAISMIKDPELLVRMGDIDTVRRIVDLHPALAEAANHIVAAAHEEVLASAKNSLTPSTSSYTNVIEISDDDDDDVESSQSSDSLPHSSQSSRSNITAAQVAAALASATADSSTSTEATTPSGTGITHEMFNEAIRTAMASVTPTVPPTSPSQPPPAPASESDSTAAPAIETPPPVPAEQMETESSTSDNELSGFVADQLQQMRELGLTDEVVNLQALIITSGNVQAAVDLVFSGALSNSQ